MAKAETVLSPALVGMLQGENIVSLITIDKDTKQPQLSVVSWVRATEDGKQVKIATGHKGTSLDNIAADPYVVLGITGPESCYAVKGAASFGGIIEGHMKYRIITVDVEEVEEVMFYGGRITAIPRYEKTYNADLVKKLDDEVHALLTAADQE